MDFQSMKRRDLQALCKLNNIPANLTNAAMADALESLQAVKGIEDLLEQSEIGALESSQKYVPNSPHVAQTLTCQKPSKEGLGCSTLSTRTRCGARRVPVDGTGTRKTSTATRITRGTEMQEASIQLEMEKDMQAKFEEDLEQSDVTADSGVESTETLEEVSEVGVDQRGAIMSWSQTQPENNDGEVFDVCEGKQNVGKYHVVNEAQEDSIQMSKSLQKLDFRSLGRKDLQNLCKRNKIPANMTNAAMADALGSLDTVEGLEEFLEGYDSLAIKSPQTSRMSSTRVCQARIAQKTTGRKSARAGSALCNSMARKMEDLNENQECPLSMNTNQGGGMSVEMDKNLQSRLDKGCLEKSEFVDFAPENSTTIYGATNPVCEELATDNQSDVLSKEFSNLLKNEVKLQVDASEKVSNDQEAKVNISSESNIAELIVTDSNFSSESSVDKCSMLEAPEAVFNGLDECSELNDNRADTRTLESECDTKFSYAPHCEGLMHDAPTVMIKGCAQLRELSDLEADNDDIEVLPDTETSKVHLEFANEVVSTEEDLDVSEDINSILHIDVDLKPEANCGIEDEHVESGFVSEISHDVATLCPISEPVDDNAEHRLSVRFVSETATQDFQHVLKGKATPLCRKSLRKLKKLVKEKLQETNLLAKKLENLTLKDNEITVDAATKVEENMREVTEETSDELNSSTVSVLSDIVEETNEGVEWKGQDVVESILTASKISEEPIEASSFSVTAIINAPKPLVFTTPIKSSSKTPIYVPVLDANKENIHDSATPVMSMGKLKKEVKVLLVQSEKRPALQSRSDNQCSLTSP